MATLYPELRARRYSNAAASAFGSGANTQAQL
jgi:hypothetical protein